ncbi:MAG: PEP-CTERM sorting domain-containing protein [Verrucomicrobiota bacterium]
MLRKPTSLFIFATVTLAGVAQANINWTWSWVGTAGIEAGFFETNGSLSGGSAPAATYTLTDFGVTQSANGFPLGSVSGGDYTIGQPTAGFVWDGSMVTQWFRRSGGSTNGTNLFQTADNVLFYAFNVGQYELRNALSGVPIDSASTLSLTAVPEPANFVAILGLVALGFVSRRKR